MKKNYIRIILVLNVLIFAACNGSGKRADTDSPVVADRADSAVAGKKVSDSTVRLAEVKSMLKKLQDTVNKYKMEKEKTQTNPPHHPNVTFPATKTPYMIAIDWEWSTHNPPSQLMCMGYIITGDGEPKLRTTATAYDCVVNAIQAYRQDRLDGAISWLCAGQCHNIDAQQDIRNGGQMAAQYALQTYGGSVPQ